MNNNKKRIVLAVVGVSIMIVLLVASLYNLDLKKTLKNRKLKIK